MAQNQHHCTAGAQLSMYGIEVFDLDHFRQLIERHNSAFDAAEKICTEALKVTTDQASQLTSRFLAAESDLNVAQGQTPVLSSNEPGTKPEPVSHHEKRAERQRGEQ